jgi:hypothetical protein
MNFPKTDISFLGREFLTWLWFKSEERDGVIMMPDVGDISIAFVRRIVLESGEGPYSETVVCQGYHADLREAKAALREGKKIKEARLRMGFGAEEWEFTFKADEFQFQSMKLPAIMKFAEEEGNTEGRILERISMVETAMMMMDRLFSLFLNKRRLPEWLSEEIPRIQHWMNR